MRQPDCSLCDGAGGPVVFQGARFRLVRAEEPGFPAFYRLVWTDHVPELSDLSVADRQLCMEGVVAVEKVLRSHLRPTKVNVASLGNVVAHLHWHVIARFDWDSHFPAPVWAPAQRPAPAAALAAIDAARPALEAALSAALAGGLGNCSEL